MILSDKTILREIEKGNIIISPFLKSCLGSNSYDVHLGSVLALYKGKILDSKKHNEIKIIKIPKKGIILKPNKLYLGVTEEYTETHGFVPFLEGKSGIGRLGIDIHSTAGKGDVGFCNHWTLELSVKLPVKIYAGMPIGQLIYFKVKGKVSIPYYKKESAKYTKRQRFPIESMLWRDFPDKHVQKLKGGIENENNKVQAHNLQC